MYERFGFWKHKYEFAEINKDNWKNIIHANFKLNLKQVCVLGMLFALEIVMTIISKYLMGSFLVMGAFAIEISFFPILFIYLCSNIFYTIFLSTISIWFRTTLGSEPIGLLSMTITDTSFIIFFGMFSFILKRLFFFPLVKSNKNLWYCIFFIISVLFAGIFAGLIALMCNNLFIFQMYTLEKDGSGFWSLMLWVGFGITICKFAINAVLFLCCWSAIKILIESLRI